MSPEEISQRQEARESLERIQSFDAKSLGRPQELGKTYEFTSVIKPAGQVIGLFCQLPVGIIDELPLHHVANIKKQADATFNLFQSILGFDPSVNDAMATRNTLIQKVHDQYKPVFDSIYSYISYAVTRTVDFSSLERDGRAAVQSIEDQTSGLIEKLNEYDQHAKETLEEVRKVASEQGVSQQATYFKAEADKQEESAGKWKNGTIALAVITVLYGCLALFLHKIPFIQPANTYETVQLVASKLIIFFVLTYMLTLTAKNFLSHRHNAVVNRHRQNALMTFTALVEAAGQEESRDIVLTHAASCIFSPQDSGYIKNTSSGDSTTKMIVETLPRSTVRIDGAG